MIGLDDIRRDKLIYHYVQGLDTGDLDRVASVLEAAVEDPELDRLIAEINIAYQEEEQLAPLAAEAQLVQDLIRQHLPSAFVPEEAEDRPLTVGEVAAHLLVKRHPTADKQEIDRRLLASSRPLPAGLSLQVVKDLMADLGVAVSNTFLRAFRDAAIMLGMAHSHSQARLAAAREQRGRYQTSGKRERPDGPPHTGEDGTGE
jgi:hypothetical protein